jgi:class 3 adenylate cyclase
MTSFSLPERPSVTSTFVFTDIEGSSRHWDLEPEATAEALRVHDELLTEVMTRHGGQVFKHTGDGVGAAFALTADALAAAAEAQGQIQRTAWPTSGPLRVRMGVHTGEAEPRRGDYFGPAVNRAARLCGLGDGGHILVSAATQVLVDGLMPAGCELRYVADVHLRGCPMTKGSSSSSTTTCRRPASCWRRPRNVGRSDQIVVRSSDGSSTSTRSRPPCATPDW